MKICVKSVVFLGILALILSVSACSSEVAWKTDLDTALVVAEKEKKDVLVVFSGSDWDGISPNAMANVFSAKPFMSKVKKDFVLVQIDFPEAEGIITEEQMEKNYANAQKYGLTGFPTVLLLTSDGDVYGDVVLDETITTPSQVLDQIKGFDDVRKQRVDLKAKIAKAEGVDKLVLIDELFESSNSAYRALLSDYLTDITLLDPENTTGLLGKYALQQAYTDAQVFMMMGDAEGAATIFIDMAEGVLLSNLEKQESYYMAAYIYAMLGSDDAVIIGYLEKALNAAPNSENVPQIQETISQIKTVAATEK